MKKAETEKIKSQPFNPNAENLKEIKNHRIAATHLEAAARSHFEAATYHEEGSHEKAAHSTITAIGHVNLAKKAQKANITKHALNGYSCDTH